MAAKQAKVKRAGLFDSRQVVTCPHCHRETTQASGFEDRCAGLVFNCGVLLDGDKEGCGKEFQIPGTRDLSSAKVAHINSTGFMGLGSNHKVQCPYCDHETERPREFEDQNAGQYLRCENCKDFFLMPGDRPQPAARPTAQQQFQPLAPRPTQPIQHTPQAPQQTWVTCGNCDGAGDVDTSHVERIVPDFSDPNSGDNSNLFSGTGLHAPDWKPGYDKWISERSTCPVCRGEKGWYE